MSEITGGLEDSSYPPVFRRETDLTNNKLLKHSNCIRKVADSEAIPVIDAECLNPVKLHEACESWGVVRLVNHGIPATLLNQLQVHARHLFSQSFQSKEALFRSSLVSYFWGTPALTPSGAALSSDGDSQNINWVEGLNVPLSKISEFQPEDALLDSFRMLLEEYGRHLSRVATTLYEAMAKSLELEPADSSPSSSHLSIPTGIVRVYRYPRCSSDGDNLQSKNRAWGLDVHTDSSILSILSQDQVGGLQVLKDDIWLDVLPISDTLILNLGDMMQAISDDRYKSVKHRVKVSKHAERISICYFVFPEDNDVIRSSNYEAFTYSDFRAQVQKDISSLGYKVGLSRFKKADA